MGMQESHQVRGAEIMTLNEIIDDIHGIEAGLEELERRYGLLSADFYHLYQTGELEQTLDFIKWVGYYEAKLDRTARYRELMYTHLRELRNQSGLGPLDLVPESVAAGVS